MINKRLRERSGVVWSRDVCYLEFPRGTRKLCQQRRLERLFVRLIVRASNFSTLLAWFRRRAILSLIAVARMRRREQRLWPRLLFSSVPLRVSIFLARRTTHARYFVPSMCQEVQITVD